MRNSVYSQGIREFTENFESVQIPPRNVLEDDTINNFNSGTDKMIKNADNLKAKILSLQQQIFSHSFHIDDSINNLDEAEQMIKNTNMEIENKKQILDDRNKKLQNTIDDNYFQKKVVWTLITVIVIDLIVFLLGFSFFRNRSY